MSNQIVEMNFKQIAAYQAMNQQLDIPMAQIVLGPPGTAKTAWFKNTFLLKRPDYSRGFPDSPGYTWLVRSYPSLCPWLFGFLEMTRNLKRYLLASGSLLFWVSGCLLRCSENESTVIYRSHFSKCCFKCFHLNHSHSFHIHFLNEILGGQPL